MLTVLLFTITAALGGLAGTATAHNRHKDYALSNNSFTRSALVETTFLDGSVAASHADLVERTTFSPSSPLRTTVYVTTTVTVTFSTNPSTAALRTSAPTSTEIAPLASPHSVTQNVTTCAASLHQRDVLALEFPQLVPEATDGMSS
ncbi:uncharacterized protein BDZ99DRAFT_567575 [Mytilinidion resinicola]|uniref:Uncharacterized protein n=1 Tax=Mytilinidion resinicola TaxID=574789 RepID=A0A6A6YYE8_9PEZI|nr:uncharacterized protein BDZ99DRAFT_567575 [Mytilinidion resinicola]KAF2813851.1 hypothetical protein BDZ99DRAFT_567575 [Mytilinidion resinicola]